RHATRKLKADQVRKTLSDFGVSIRAASWKGICEEAPEAYKDIEEVVAVSVNAGLGTLVARMRPMGVLKG
ncbi:MAG: RtcB family protein, partial [Candidatus Wallbacteria bacterium]|nr:RtcB family protein [Candidatus Wallbacteria bacterium]